MKNWIMVSTGAVFIFTLCFILHAQEAAPTAAAPVGADGEMDASLQALESVPPMPASRLPVETHGFYSVQNPQWPPMPADVLGLNVWSLGDGFFAVDDRSVNYDEVQAAMEAAGLVRPMGSGFSPLFLTDTNDLWLEMVTVTNGVAALVIHPPWDQTNSVYDLRYCTNLDPPIAWQWLLRSDPGQTNLFVANATDAAGFYQVTSPNDLTANDSLGTNFWVAFFNMLYDGDENLSLYISSPVGATGTVTIPRLGITNTFTVVAGAVTNISIPQAAMIVDYNVVQINGIQITSSQPVSVYGFDYDSTVSSAFTGYPTTLLGTNYCLLVYAGNQFVIVATTDNTTVTIMPSINANLSGHSGTNAYTETLQQGETYQIDGGDVTGTQITSDKPVGVFAGSQLEDVPTGVFFGNPLVQEQMPVADWGMQALALSFAGRTRGDSYRVLAANNNTVITITTTNRVIVVTNQAGGFYQTILDGPVEFQGSQPIQVAQFANGTTFDSATNAAGNPNEGDPSEILLPSTGFYLETNVVFSLPNNDVNGDFDENYLNIIVAQSAITNTLVDGSIVASTNFVAIGTSGYSGARLSVTNGVHQVTSPRPVGVQVYGFGQYDAYSYFGGIVK